VNYARVCVWFVRLICLRCVAHWCRNWLFCCARSLSCACMHIVHNMLHGPIVRTMCGAYLVHGPCGAVPAHTWLHGPCGAVPVHTWLHGPLRRHTCAYHGALLSFSPWRMPAIVLSPCTFASHEATDLPNCCGRSLCISIFSIPIL